MKKLSGGTVVGLIFLVLGILYAGASLGLYRFTIFFPGFWTLFLIVPCFYGLFKKGEDKTGYLIGLAAGILLLINAQDWGIHIRFWPLLLAVVCILLGVRLIFGKQRPGASVEVEYASETGEKTVNVNVNAGERQTMHSENGFVKVSVFFSGKDIRVDGEAFQGAELSAVFGGIDLDLRQAVIAQDVVINVTTVFGGIDIHLPDHVRVVTNDCAALFGGVDVKRREFSIGNEYVPVVYIRGNCLFGGVEVK